jgi:radical SAM superfamily enzyme YgiQ (UPF0313 family)
VLGGYGPSPIPDYILKETGADVIAIGEGEETMIEIMMARRNMGISLADIKSIAYRDGGKTVITERRSTIKYLNELPLPAWDLFPMREYTLCL